MKSFGGGCIPLASVEAQENRGSDFEGAGDVDEVETARACGGGVLLRECEGSGEHGGMVNLGDLETACGDILGEVLPEQCGLFGGDAAILDGALKGVGDLETVPVSQSDGRYHGGAGGISAG
jgi:hypothetical protein